jgi:uncharacterized membrane protein YeaQ/YmgE (transglycosylase-associated protein family)
MSDLIFSSEVEQWIKVVLIWVGFGTIAGLLASVLFPLRRPAGGFWAVVLGTTGSAVGLLGLSWLFPAKEFNPISPMGFLAATVGAFVLLAIFRLGQRLSTKPTDDEEDDDLGS